MLNKLRGFSNSKLAMVVVGIIIIPFVFWGMGDVFTRGNTNNVAKINNNTISVTDFIKHVNDSGLSETSIRENLNKNFNGPIIVYEDTATSYIDSNCSCEIHSSGSIIISL